MHQISVFIRLAASAGLVVGGTLAWRMGAAAPAPASDGVAIQVVGIGITEDGTVAGNAKRRAVMLRGRSVNPVVGGERDTASRVTAVSRAGNVAGMMDDSAGGRGFVRLRDGALHALPAGFRPVAVNDAGVVVGSLTTETRAHSAVWRAGQALHVIPDTDEARFVAVDINDRGEVVGGTGVWSRGALRRYPEVVQAAEAITWGAAIAINNRGEVLANGYGASGGPRPFIWSGGTARALAISDSTGQVQEVTATDINDRGEVVGSYTVYGGGMEPTERFAVLWGRRGVRVLPGMRGTRSCAATAVNDAGTVLGECEFRAPWMIGEGSYLQRVPVIWENGAARPLCGGGVPRRGEADPCDSSTYTAGQPPQVLTASVHPDLPPYRLEFEVRDGVPVSVTVQRADGAGEAQWFEIPDGANSSQPVQLRDLNFDGYRDMSIVTMGGVHNESFNYYLFKPATSSFAFFRGDNLLVPDSTRRELVQPIHGSCCAGELNTYRWRGKELVLVRSEVWMPWPKDGTRTLRVVSELRDGRMVKVSSEVGEPER